MKPTLYFSGLWTMVIFLVLAHGKVALTASVQAVDVVVGPTASELERFAAEELKTQLQRLLDVKVNVRTEVPSGQTPIVLVGSPQTNPSLHFLAKDWPHELSDQGIAILSVDFEGRTALVVGGGSPVATLWAVYELGYQCGIRYLSRGDFYPETPIDMDWESWEMVLEPTLRSRTWRTVNCFAIGPESWGLEDQKKLLGQLAKMKYNQVMINIWPWQPFVHYEFDGLKKQTAKSWFGERFRVDGDTPGKKVFAGAKYFENPDLARKTSYEDLTAAGVKLVRGIIDEAQRLGMKVGIGIYPCEFPREFAKVIPRAKTIRQLNRLTVGPGVQQGPDNLMFRELVSTKIHAYLETYPTLDAIYLSLPEFPEWDEHVEASWQRLFPTGAPSGATIDDLIAIAGERDLIVGGERGRQALRGNIVSLAFFHSLFSDTDLLRRPDGQPVQLHVTQLDSALFSLMDRVIPAGAKTLNFVDYTARRVVANGHLLADVPADKVSSQLILTLADDNVGVLQQSTLNSIHNLVQVLRQHGWDGYSTRYWMLSELDPTLQYLSRATFDDSASPRSAFDELFVALTGKTSSAERLWIAFQHLEKATNMIDEHGLGLSFPVRGMLMRHYRPQPAPEWWSEVKDLYTQAMIEFFRSASNTHPRASDLLNYYAQRAVYVTEYISCLESLREAAIDKQAGDLEATAEKLEAATESLYNAIDRLSNVAHDQSDRGLIAVLTEFAYRPLIDEYESVLEEIDL